MDYSQKRYAYEVTKKYKVDDRFALAIEGLSQESKVTLYTCDMRGEEVGCEAVEAMPLR